MIEKDWITRVGYRAVCVHRTFYRCGYVQVPKEHPFFGVDCREHVPDLSEVADRVRRGSRGYRNAFDTFFDMVMEKKTDSIAIAIDVHGSVTFSGDSVTGVKGSSGWWFGFDCAHAGDNIFKGLLKEYEEVFGEKFKELFEEVNELERDRGVERTVEYVVEECELLAKQLLDVGKEVSHKRSLRK